VGSHACADDFQICGHALLAQSSELLIQWNTLSCFRLDSKQLALPESSQTEFVLLVHSCHHHLLTIDKISFSYRSVYLTLEWSLTVICWWLHSLAKLPACAFLIYPSSDLFICLMLPHPLWITYKQCLLTSVSMAWHSGSCVYLCLMSLAILTYAELKSTNCLCLKSA